MEIQRICIIYNPVAGSGLSRSVAEELKARLDSAGLQVQLNESSPGSGSSYYSFLADTDLAIVAGGDGTLMTTLPFLAEYRTPIYMVPTGNESLFAREFGMSSQVENVLDTIKRNKLSEHYIASVNNTPFFTMASLGLDSEVIEGVSRKRTGTITRWSYFRPMLRAARKHQAPRITLTVDGAQCLDGADGFLIVANNRQYAMGAAFVPEAQSSQPELCARFFPYKGTLHFFSWCLLCLFNLRFGLKSAPLFRGSDFEISVDNEHGYPVQADGEFVGRSTRSTITIAKNKLRVLEP